MRHFARFILKFRILIIASVLALTALSGVFLPHLKINSDVTTYLPDNDTSVALFKYIGQEYGTSWSAVVIIESDNIFSKETIAHINEITTKLRNTEGIESVTSLTSILDIKTTEDGFEIARLIDEYELPETPEALAALKEYTLSKDIYKGQLVSADGRFTIIMCQISGDHNKNLVAQAIKQTVKDGNYPEKFYFDGMPFQVMGIMQFVIDDLILLTPMIVLIILLTLYLSFRSFRGVLLPVVSVGMGISWIMAVMAIFHIELTPLSDALPVVLFAVGSAYGIHVVNRIKMIYNDANLKSEQLTRALTEVVPAVFLAGITTFAGFLSFILGSYLTIVRDFGIFASLGVLFILLISLTFIPALISFFPPEKQKKGQTARLDLIAKLISFLSAHVVKYRKGIFTGALLLMAAGFAGIPFIGRKVDILEYFRKDTDIRISASVMNREFGGSLPVQIVVKGDILTPEVLQILDSTAHFLQGLEGISNVRSVSDYIIQMNDAMGEGKKVPDSREKIANLWFMVEGESMMTQMINHSRDEAVVYATMKNLDASDVHEINDSIEAFCKKMSTDTVKITPTGLQAVYSKLDDSMMKNLIQSMVMAFIFIFITMLFLLRSFKGALVGMSTLFFSVVFIFGFMGFTGIALDIATILIASLTVGTGIDYSIHFVTSYRMFLGKGEDISSAIASTINTTGKAIVINVITIMLGFLVLLFANLIPLQQFGILVAVTMLCSGLGSLTLMPAIISIFNIRISKNKPIKK